MIREMKICVKIETMFIVLLIKKKLHFTQMILKASLKVCLSYENPFAIFIKSWITLI